MRLLLILVMIFFVSCSSKQNADEPNIEFEKKRYAKRIPQWLKNDKQTALQDVGMTKKMRNGGMFLQVLDATENAKESLQKKLTKILKKIITKAFVGTKINQEQLEKFNLRVSTQTSLLAKGSMSKKNLYFDPSQNVYILVEIDKKELEGIFFDNMEVYLDNFEQINAIYESKKISEKIITLFNDHLKEDPQ